MDHTKITAGYMESYNEAVERHKKEKIENLVEEINTAISKSDMEKTNIIFEKISDWNNYISSIQGIRDALVTYNKSIKIPSIKEFLIVYDHITKEWRFNTEVY